MAMTSPGQDKPAAQTFETLPAEIRIKIYHDLFSGFKLKYTIADPITKKPGCAYVPEDSIVLCQCEPRYPFAILTVNKKLSEEAIAISRSCPVFLDVRGCTIRSSWKLIVLSVDVRHRIHSVVTDEQLWKRYPGFLKWCSEPTNYPALREVEIQGPMVFLRGSTKATETFIRTGVWEHQLGTAEFEYLLRSWPKYVARLEPNITSGQLNLRMQCSIPYVVGEIRGVLLWSKLGMTMTDVKPPRI
ncbi:hypothetical protein H2200_005475 [Cladophialophora chaetospira]|uniref:Uncharacterized protein n=1 Tax=Cladophialophora chaetospira TaxID=386627 RepID=A0AA38XC22_9EURO|nr:hypothetical protein H2200_005475 [Cladophialophora chaetospira]